MAQAKRSKRSSGKSAGNGARRASSASSRGSSRASARGASASRSASARSASARRASGRRSQKQRNGGASRRNAQLDTQNRWSAQDDRELKNLIKQNTPARVMGQKLGRSESAVRQHAYKLGLSLRSANR